MRTQTLNYPPSTQIINSEPSTPQLRPPETLFMGTSLVRKRTPLVPYRRPLPKVLRGSEGGGCFLLGVAPLEWHNPWSPRRVNENLSPKPSAIKKPHESYICVNEKRSIFLGDLPRRCGSTPSTFAHTSTFGASASACRSRTREVFEKWTDPRIGKGIAECAIRWIVIGKLHTCSTQDCWLDLSLA
jgi:hypothetical protein